MSLGTIGVGAGLPQRIQPFFQRILEPRFGRAAGLVVQMPNSRLEITAALARVPPRWAESFTPKASWPSLNQGMLPGPNPN